MVEGDRERIFYQQFGPGSHGRIPLQGEAQVPAQSSASEGAGEQVEEKTPLVEKQGGTPQESVEAESAQEQHPTAADHPSVEQSSQADTADKPSHPQQDQPSTEGEWPTLVFSPPVGDGSFVFGGFAVRRRPSVEQSSQADTADGSRISYKRYRKVRHGGEDHSPGPNNPSKAK